MEKDVIPTDQFEITEDWIENIALPNQLPAKDINPQSNIAKGKSSALDALINQNEDLMSRLAVNIRRNSLLEERVEELNKSHEELQAELESLNDQVLILKHKDQYTQKRKEQIEAEHQSLVDQIEFLEAQSSEYYTNAQKVQIIQLKVKLKSYSKYRKKISSIAKQFRQELELKTQHLNTEVARTQQLREHIEKLTAHLHSQKQEFEDIKSQLIEGYEEQVDELKSSVSKLKETEQEHIKLKTKHSDLQNEVVSLKNSLIESKRQVTSLSEKHEAELTEIQELYHAQKHENKVKTVKLNEQDEAIKDLTDKLNDSKQQNQTLTDQVENLQILWSEAQESQEKLKSQNTSLQKLNQQLSIEMNRLRAELKQSKMRTESTDLNLNTKKDKTASVKKLESLLSDIENSQV